MSATCMITYIMQVDEDPLTVKVDHLKVHFLLSSLFLSHLTIVGVCFSYILLPLVMLLLI